MKNAPLGSFIKVTLFDLNISKKFFANLGLTFHSWSHDSVLKLNDIRTVSINRILYQQQGRIDLSSDTYKQIEKLVLQKYFPGFYHDYMQGCQTIDSLKEQLKEVTKKMESLEIENNQLKEELKK